MSDEPRSYPFSQSDLTLKSRTVDKPHIDHADREENDLEMKCPKCANRGRFRIPVTVGRIVTPNGHEDDPMAADEEYDGDSPCECAYCQHSGTVHDFQMASAISLEPKGAS